MIARDITIELTTDENYIKSVFLNPKIYSQLRDDSHPIDPDDLRSIDIMSIPGFFLKVFVDGVAAGIFWGMYKGDEVEAHTALLDNCRGRMAIIATKKAIKWVFDNTEAKVLTSYAWSDCPAVKWFCRSVGMKTDRTEKWSNTRNGKSVDITYFSINRGELI